MKVSVSWLKELAPGLRADADEIARRLTASGLEVEGRTRVGDFAGVIVAEVRDKRRHPQADKLTLVDVWDGHAVTQVVCGAPNVPAPGGKVAWARPGARLPSENGHRVLEAREVRGILSPGMLCAEDELGIGTSHDGILLLDDDAEPGADVAQILGLPDTILELNVTPNRPDALGHVGVLREVVALIAPEDAPFDLDRLVPADLDEADAPPVGSLASVELVDAVGCPRYTARVIEGVKVGPSPLRVRLRLQSLGVRAINNVVDATNLLLLETGHPLHAFDLDRLAGRRIVVRRAAEGEVMATLDGQERKLTAEDVAICDVERPVAVAGVMGGRDSEVGEGTTRLLLESAYFEPARIRRTGRRLGLKTEASHRFERGADPNDGVLLSSARCAQLIRRLAGGRVARGVIDAYPSPIEPVEVALRPKRTDLVLGMHVPAERQLKTLAALGLVPVVASHKAPLRAVEAAALATGHATFRVPTWRPDLTREIDLIEEIARVHGYDAVPATFPSLEQVLDAPRDERPEAARDALIALGFSECVTYAFVGPDRIAALGFAPGDRRSQPIRLANPLREEHAALRTSLVPGLLMVVARNASRGVVEQRVFETGMSFLPHATPPVIPGHLPPAGRDESLPEERRLVTAVMVGRRPGWLKPGEELDFFDVKGVVEGVLEGLGVASATFRSIETDEAPWLHPGLSAAVVVDGQVAGVLGEVHPAVRDRYGVEARCFAFELDVERLGLPSAIAAREAPRFPGSTRDVSFFVDRAVPAAALAAVMREASPLVEAVRPLEDYREEGRVPAGKKGMLFSLGYRARERTLTDAEVGLEHGKVLDALKARFAVEPR